MKNLICLLALSFAVTSCDQIVEDVIDSSFDCLDNDGPAFLTSTLEDATVGTGYIQTIETEIDREPDDDSFFYRYSVIDSDLPQGLFLNNGDNGRLLTLSGVPNDAGTHRFTIRVEVSENSDFDNEDSSLCRTRETREFTLVIHPSAS